MMKRMNNILYLGIL